jgi:hypothetical protein
VSEENKALVRRLVDGVINGGRLELVEELFASELAEPARQAFSSFRAAEVNRAKRTLRRGRTTPTRGPSCADAPSYRPTGTHPMRVGIDVGLLPWTSATAVPINAQ